MSDKAAEIPAEFAIVGAMCGDSELGIKAFNSLMELLYTLRAANAELEAKVQELREGLRTQIEISRMWEATAQETERELQAARDSANHYEAHLHLANARIKHLESSLAACQQEVQDAGEFNRTYQVQLEAVHAQLNACREELKKEKAK